MTRVCLVIGAGAGIGGSVGKRFAREGYHAVLCRRSDQAGLDGLVAAIEAAGGSATGRLLDATKDDTLEKLMCNVLGFCLWPSPHPSRRQGRGPPPSP